MIPKIVNLEPQTVLFVRQTGPYGEASTAAFAILMRFAYQNRLMQPTSQLLGIVYDSPDITDPGKLRYDACLTLAEPVAPQGEVGVQTVAGGRYAVFTHQGSYENFNEAYRRIYSHWLPPSGERLREAPVFERYHNRDPRRTKPENLRTDIYLPLE